MPAHFGNKSATGSKRAMDAGKNGVRVAHPVKSRVAEDRIEFTVKRELLAITNASIEAELQRGGDLRVAGIHAHYMAPERGKFGSEHAVTAAEVEDAFSALRRQKFDNGSTEISDEACVASVKLWVPDLRMCGETVHLP
jgi:hypothetical protein